MNHLSCIRLCSDPRISTIQIDLDDAGRTLRSDVRSDAGHRPDVPIYWYSNIFTFALDRAANIFRNIRNIRVFEGYYTQSFIVDSVLKSVAEGEPKAIDPNAGFYGYCFI